MGADSPKKIHEGGDGDCTTGLEIAGNGILKSQGKSMEWVQQPRGSKTCGQAVVATVLQVPLEHVLTLLGDGPTGITRIVQVLRAQGVGAFYESTEEWPEGLPGRAIISARSKTHPPGGWHWLLWWDGVLWDPYPWRSDPPMWCLEDWITLEGTSTPTG